MRPRGGWLGMLAAVALMAVGTILAVFAFSGGSFLRPARTPVVSNPPTRTTPAETTLAPTPTTEQGVGMAPHDSPTVVPSSTATSPVVTPTPRSQWPREQMAMLAQVDPLSHCYSNLWADTFEGRTIAFVGSKNGRNGVQVVDVTDPHQTKFLQTWQPDGAKDEILDVRTLGHYALFGGIKGVYIVDFSDALHPTQVALIKAGPGEGEFSEVHTISLWKTFLFVADNTGPEVEVFDLTDSLHPVRLSPVTDPIGQVHGVTAIDGRLYAASTHPKGSMSIWDISALPSGSPILIANWEAGEMTHSSWPSPDGKFLAVNHEMTNGALDIWDIRDAAQPQKVFTIAPQAFGFGTYSVHDTVWLGDKLYAGWDSAGAQVFDVSDPYDPVHLMGFDTTLGAGGEDTSDGSWAVFPFLGPDRILTADWHNGVFVLDSTRTVPVSSLPRNQGASSLNTSC